MPKWFKISQDAPRWVSIQQWLESEIPLWHKSVTSLFSYRICLCFSIFFPRSRACSVHWHIFPEGFQSGPPQSLTLELKGLISPPLWQHIRTENEQYQYPCCWALGEVWMVWCSQGYPLENSCWALHHSYHLEVLLKAVVPVRSVMVGCVDDSQSSHLGAF